MVRSGSSVSFCYFCINSRYLHISYSVASSSPGICYSPSNKRGLMGTDQSSGESDRLRCKLFKYPKYTGIYDLELGKRDPAREAGAFLPWLYAYCGRENHLLNYRSTHFGSTVGEMIFDNAESDDSIPICPLPSSTGSWVIPQVRDGPEEGTSLVTCRGPTMMFCDFWRYRWNCR